MNPNQYMMYSYGHGYGYGFGPFDFFFHLIGFIIIIAVIIVALRLIIMGRPRRWRHMMGNSALDILAERYAKGEIDKEEYEERRKVLGQ